MRLEQPHRHCQQYVVIMRHGDRLDSVDRSWPSTAPRPWDPPLAEVGQARALEMGKHLPSRLGYPIHRVVVSPFRRCVDTALGLIAGLSAPDAEPNVVTGGSGVDPSKVKVHQSLFHIHLKIVHSCLHVLMTPMVLVLDNLFIIMSNTFPFCRCL